MTLPEFKAIDDNLWYWNGWLIAFAYDVFWLLTPTPREFGPFATYDQVIEEVQYLR